MIEIRLHDSVTIAVDGATRYHGAKLTEIPNREFIKSGSRWLVPLSRLGAVIGIVGQQNVSIDYDVLKARDEQLRRIVAQYAAVGVRIWNDGGKLATDHPLLTQALQPIAPLLLDWLPTEPGERRQQRRKVVTQERVEAPQKREAGEFGQLSLESLIVGIQNAHAKQEKDMQRKRVRR